MNAVLKPAEILYARERMADVVQEIQPLLEKHWQEIAHYPDIPLAPDWPLYELAEQNGCLAIYTARAASVLMGYAVYFVRENAHYRGSIQAQQDVLFLHPVVRRGGVGMRLLKFSENDLRERGVQVIYQHFKFKHDLAPLLARLGYSPMDQIWAKRL